MSTTPDPVVLQNRAAALRWLAIKLEGCPVDGLAAAANHETWLGPTADRCREALALHVQAITDAAAHLRSRANALDHQAATIALTLRVT